MMTINPAKTVNLHDIVGTIEVGKYADVILLGSNPMDDIANTRDVKEVFKFGIPVLHRMC